MMFEASPEILMALQEMLADAEDLLTLRAAKRAEQDAPTISLAQLKQEMGNQ